MFGNLFGKPAATCIHANENPNVCECAPGCVCFGGTCQNRIPERQNGKIVHVNPPEDKCLMCGNTVKDAYWKYVWKGKDGYMCRDTCGRDFHTIGYYLLDKAAEILNQQGIKVFQAKEKFGIMMIYTQTQTDIEKHFVESFEQMWRERYPEFEWAFS